VWRPLGGGQTTPVHRSIVVVLVDDVLVTLVVDELVDVVVVEVVD
jgi:hypothetical protein